MKKILCCFAVAVLMAGLVGCACNDQTAMPTPAPSANPTAGMSQAPSPALSASPDAGASTSPDMSASPDASTSPDAAKSPDASASTIPNFKEGTEVKPEDAPDVQKAVTEKYPKAEIEKIKHATKDGKQVYEVTLKNDTKTETVYVLPDGKLMDAASTAKP